MERKTFVKIMLYMSTLILLAYIIGYFHGRFTVIIKQPIVRELDVDEIFLLVKKNKGRIVLPRGKKDLVIVPRLDGGVTLRYERRK